MSYYEPLLSKLTESRRIEYEFIAAIRKDNMTAEEHMWISKANYRIEFLDQKIEILTEIIRLEKETKILKEKFFKMY